MGHPTEVFRRRTYEELAPGFTSTVFAPVRAVDAPEDQPAAIVLAIDAASLRKRVDPIAEARARGDESAAEQYAAAHGAELRFEATVEGVVRRGYASKDDDHQLVRDEIAPLADDFVIVDHGEEPSARSGALLLLVGVFALGLGLALARTKLQRAREFVDETLEEGEIDDSP